MIAYANMGYHVTGYLDFKGKCLMAGHIQEHITNGSTHNGEAHTGETHNGHSANSVSNGTSSSNCVSTAKSKLRNKTKNQ